MRALIQCVDRAGVEAGGKEISQIGYGYLIFLGVGQGDSEEEADKLWNKIWKMRVFPDEEGKTNLSLDQVGGDVLVVSQFTLYADCRRGNRPSFTPAAPPDQGEALYDYFVSLVRQDVPRVGTGEFGADMKVSLVNDGPFTIWLDTAQMK